MRQRIKVNRRNRWVPVFAHSADGQLLYFKERFLGAGHLRRSEIATFSAKLRKLGVSDSTMLGPRKKELAELRDKAGLNENLNRRQSPVPTKMSKITGR